MPTESVPVWSSSLPQCNHRASSQYEFLAPTMRGVNRSQIVDGPSTSASYTKISFVSGHSSGIAQEAAAPKNTAVDPLFLSLRI